MNKNFLLVCTVLFITVTLLMVDLYILTPVGGKTRTVSRMASLSVSLVKYAACELVSSDPDFLIKITKCDTEAISGYLTFNSSSNKTSLTAPFKIKSSEYNFEKTYTIDRASATQIPFTINFTELGIDFPEDMKLEWGTGTSTVSVTQSSVYKVTGETVNGVPRYIVDIENTGTEIQGAERNLTVFNYKIPYYIQEKGFFVRNSTNDYGVLSWSKSNSSLIENGPVRVQIKAENKTSTLCWISPEVICINYSVEYWLYPRYYMVKFYIEGNYTESHIWGYDLPYYISGASTIRIGAAYWLNGTYKLAKNTTGDLGVYSTTVAFYYNETNINTTLAWFPTASSPLQAGPWSLVQPAYRFMQLGSSSNYGIAYSLAYGVAFADSGQRSLDENGTVWDLGVKDQWNDYYYPAAITAITGTSQARDNTTGTYNLTASSGKVDFNFTLGNYNRTYPVFQIKNLRGISSVANYVYVKNYTATNNTWQKWTNDTDFILQEGNSTYFGYDFILMMPNKTFYNSSQTYEFWISNSSEPVPPQYSLNSTNNTKAGLLTQFSLNWTDNVGLGGYIFSTNNTGTWVNDSWTGFTFVPPNSVFADGFESGNFSAWLSTDGSPDIVSNIKHSGRYSMRVNNSGEYARWDANIQPSFAREYVYFNDMPSTNNYATLMYVQPSGGNYPDIRVFNNSGTLNWTLRDNSGTLRNATTGPIKNTWYAVELGINSSGTYMFIDGVLLTTGTSYNPSVTRFYFGGSGTDNSTIYVDDAVVSSSYIGLESSMNAWSNTTKTLNSTVGTNVQWKVYANDTSNNWNTSQTYSLTTTDGNPPQWDVPNWYYDSWQYRKNHNISGSTAGNQTNYQMNIAVINGTGTGSGGVVYINNKARSDFGDIRFTWYNDTSGQELESDYWIENVTNGVNATFWVEIPFISNVTSNTIYIYYGKSDATTTSNGTNTFPFFDDFSVSPNGWTLQNSGTISGGNLVIPTGIAAAQVVAYKTRPSNLDNYRFRTGLAGTATTNNGWYISARGFSTDQTAPYFLGRDYFYNPLTQVYVVTQGGVTLPNLGPARDSLPHIIEYTKFGSNFVEKWDALNNSGTDATAETGTLVTFGYWSIMTSVANFDWVFLAKYVSPEPSHGSWGSEESRDNKLINNTYAGRPTLFSLNWTDNVGLSGYIFSTNNTGSWVNDSFVDFENQTGNVIFKDGFESGDFSKWSSVTGSPTIQSNNIYHGKYAMQSPSNNTNSSYARYDFASSQSTVYLRAYFKIDVLPDGWLEIKLGSIWAAGERMEISLVGNAGAYTLRINDYINPVKSSAIAITPNTWNSYEARRTVGNGNGVMTLYFNGVELATNASAVITGNATWLQVGNLYSYYDAGNSYFDRAVVSSSYIGPDTGWSNVTKTLNSKALTPIGWRVYANDTSNNWNASEIFTVVTVGANHTVYTVSGIALDYLTGGVISSGTVTAVVKETGDKYTGTISNGVWTVDLSTPANYNLNKLSLGIILNSSDNKNGYEEITIGTDAPVAQSASCTYNSWTFSGYAIDLATGSTQNSGTISVSVDDAPFSNSTSNSTAITNGYFNIYFYPCLISGKTYTFHFNTFSGGVPTSQMAWKTVAK